MRLLLVGGAFVCWLVYSATIGPSGFVRTIAADLHACAIAFLDHLTASIDQLATAGKTGQQSQQDLRTVARQFAAGMEAIGKKLDVDVEAEAAAIAATLDRSPS